ncbi:MAG: DUF2240 family protein [Methanomicrobiales archaeon]
MTLPITVAAPFKHTRKSGMRKNELVYYYALDRKWMSTDQANQLLRRAEEDGFLALENGIFTPRFDLAAITIPIGFKPTSAIFERNDPAQELIGRIAKAKNIQEIDIVAEMNKTIRDGFDGHLLPPAAVVLLAKKYNVPFEDLSESLRQSLNKG